MEIKNKVLNYINKHKLISHGDTIICAVSGGADSVCMLDILVELKDQLDLKLYVAHLNHGLRGEEALRDALFVENLCKKYSLPFHCKNVDVNELAKKLKTSCEEAGRIARYDFFNELKQSLNAQKISTAHNINDNTETVLMRILRGTDIKGLSGIPPHNHINVIRPILCLTRCEIEEYLKCKGLEFVTDSTNFENDFTRNKIRNQLIPLIEKDYNPSFVSVFSSNIDLIYDANNFIENYVNEKFNTLVNKEFFGFKFDTSALLKEDVYVVKRIIKKTVFDLVYANITNKVCDKIYESLSVDTKMSVTDNLDLYTAYDAAYFVIKRETKEFAYNFRNFGTYYIPEISAFLDVLEYSGVPRANDKNCIYLDKDLLSCDFVLRSRKNGDKMYLANCGTKKIKDILIDEKIPVFLRDTFPVLEYNGKIIWLCGVRDDTTYRTSQGKKYIKIALHKEKDHA